MKIALSVDLANLRAEEDERNLARECSATTESETRPRRLLERERERESAKHKATLFSRRLARPWRAPVLMKSTPRGA